MNRKSLALAAILLLTACGKVADLTPMTGHELPPRPALASATPDAEKLLQPPPIAAPQRVDELLKKGEPRKPDRFDLPPAAGVESQPAATTTAPDNQSEPQ